MDEKEKLIQSLIDDGYLKNPLLIDAFRAVDRADFVAPEYKDEAYVNSALPIGAEQTISQPLTVAFMLELLDPKPGEKILDVGSGSGWTAALLAHIVLGNSVSKLGRILGIERIPELCEFGKKNLAKYFSENQAKIICEDGTKGMVEEAPFDKILASASAFHKIPQAWRDQLKIGGKIVAPVGTSIWCYEKKEKITEGKEEIYWEEHEYPGFVFVPLLKDKNLIPEDEIKKEYQKNFFSKIRSILIWFFVIFSVFAVNELYIPHASYTETKEIIVPQGFGSRMIGTLLKNEGVIRSKTAFVTYVSLLEKASSLKPGTYVFGPMAISNIVDELVRGGKNERTTVIPEGWSILDIAEYFLKEGISSKEDFENSVSKQSAEDLKERFDFLNDKPMNVGLEGYLFPDTYRIFIDAVPTDIVEKMLENFDKKLTLDLREEIAHQKKTIFEIVTIASLIEKEVVSDEDRALVSGILWKRLEALVPLQVDATISYITGKKTTKITRDDTRVDSPYNTYLYRGLPKGPIGNPGIFAIRAAIYPKSSPYWYYLSAPDGTTIFSRTLDEHNEAKAKYLK